MKEVDVKYHNGGSKGSPRRGIRFKKKEEPEISLGFHKGLFQAFIFLGVFLGLFLNISLSWGEEWARFIFRWSLMMSIVILLCSSIRTSFLCERGRSAKELICAKIRDVMLGFLSGIFLSCVLFYITKHIGIFLLRAVVE